jgi:malate dehydrogenase
MGVPADGSYHIPAGLIAGYPCTCTRGEWSIVTGLELDAFARERIETSVRELQDERDAVSALGLI